MKTKLLIITWNISDFILALHMMKDELKNVDVELLNVHKLNNGEINPPNFQLYEGVILIQMGCGGWEKILESQIKSLRLFVSFKSKLDSLSTVSSSNYETLNKYLAYSGLENIKNFVKYCLKLLGHNVSVHAPIHLPWHGIYYLGSRFFNSLRGFLNWYGRPEGTRYVGILFYRRRLLFNDIEAIDAIIKAFEKRGFGVIPVFTDNFPDPRVGAPGAESAIKEYFILNGKPIISALVWSLHFRVCPSDNTVLKELNVPVINAIETFGLSMEDWRKSSAGLSPIEVSMSLALPELDGTIDPIVCSFEKIYNLDSPLIIGEKIIKVHEPNIDRIERLVSRVSRWIKLQEMPNVNKKVAIILHCSNIGNSEGNVGTALGLDSGQSVIEILKHLKNCGYMVDEIPPDGSSLIKKLIQDNQIWPGRWSSKSASKPAAIISYELYNHWFTELPKSLQDSILNNWGPPPKDGIGIPGIYFGNIFVTIQPPRVPNANKESIHKLIHDPTLPPPHYYYCFYRFLNESFDVIIHVGKHGSVEWLPGKSVGLSEECYPDVCLREIPNAYIYIVNNPAEGTQAKRRGYSTIIDHMAPPMISNEKYLDLEKAIYEYINAKKRDLKAQIDEAKKIIIEKCKSYNFTLDESRFDDEVIRIHARIQELNTSLFNYGLHIFGKLPEKDLLTKFIISIINPEKIVLETLGIPYNKFLENPLYEWKGRTLSELVKDIRAACAELIQLGVIQSAKSEVAAIIEKVKSEILTRAAEVEKKIVAISEIQNLLKCLDACYVEPGPSGDVTRGRITALPTGRNFYSIDPLSIPTRSAYEVGKKLAIKLLERYRLEEGKLPETIAFVEWFTDPTNTDGEQIAEILYLLGVKPIWDVDRVIGLDIIPLEELGRPRIDVVVRIGGLFRDTCPTLIELIDEAILKVASLNEPPELNFVRKHFLEDGVRFRIFGDQPGVYGAGVNHAINSSVWKSDEELAEIFINWGCYAYGKNIYGVKAEKELRLCLKRVDATVRNQYTDEWDILDDDCPYAYQGGLTLAAERESKKKVRTFISDTRNPDMPKVVDISEEVDRVVRNTLFNPEWIEGMKKHGYKGASDLMKKVVNLFGWSATTHAVSDWIFKKIAETYIFDSENRAWLEGSNVYALEEIIRRLYEAYSRGLWNAPDEVIHKLKMKYLEVEGMLEETIK